MTSICFIGARGGSKGVPKKNIRKLGNKPLIAYSIESALDSNLFDNSRSVDSEALRSDCADAQTCLELHCRRMACDK